MSQSARKVSPPAESEVEEVSFEDLSTNGSYFNGDSLENEIKVDLSRGPCEVRLGTRETFADLGATIAEVLGIGAIPVGVSFAAILFA